MELTEVIKTLSPFHKAIARRIAQGERMKDICTAMHISASRLSVLKSSPLMKKAVAHYERLVEKGFEKARAVLDTGAEQAAKNIVQAIKDQGSTLSESEKVKVSFGLLDRLGVKVVEKRKETQSGQLMFEQTLRIVKNSGLEQAQDDFEKEFIEVGE